MIQQDVIQSLDILLLEISILDSEEICPYCVLE